MDTDRPSQEGREDVPSELNFFSLSARSRSDARSDASERGTRPEPTLAMVTTSGAREGRGISVTPEAQIETQV